MGSAAKALPVKGRVGACHTVAQKRDYVFSQYGSR